MFAIFIQLSLTLRVSFLSSYAVFFFLLFFCCTFHHKSHFQCSGGNEFIGNNSRTCALWIFIYKQVVLRNSFHHFQLEYFPFFHKLQIRNFDFQFSSVEVAIACILHLILCELSHSNNFFCALRKFSPFPIFSAFYNIFLLLHTNFFPFVEILENHEHLRLI